jgi:hypothetical protein
LRYEMFPGPRILLIEMGLALFARHHLDWNQQPPNQNWGLPNCTIRVFGGGMP